MYKRQSLPPEELAKADMSSMICLIANAAPVPYSLKEEIVAKLGEGWLFEVYGSTELGVDTVLPPEDQLRKPGSCGKPYGGIEIKIVNDDGEPVPTGDPGELFVRTKLAMDGYHRTSEQLTELKGSQWKSVGDVAYVDDEGYVYICDRKKDMIISGGVNIYPAEIEAVLYGHPQVLDAAVFGIPDDEWGERVHAIVQPKAGETIDLAELKAFAEEHLARYKQPRAYELRDALPRTDSGKLLKRVLREPFFWSPSREQLAGIRAEWEMYRDQIRDGRGYVTSAAHELGLVVSASPSRFARERPGRDEGGKTVLDVTGRAEGDVLVPGNAKNSRAR